MTIPIVCRSRLLARDRQVEAATKAIEVYSGNLPEGVDPSALDGDEKDKLAVEVGKWWGQEVDLTVGFLDSPSISLPNRIVEHMNAWSINANVRFRQTQQDPVVRIARFNDVDSAGSGGYWSYIGTDVYFEENDKPTLNLEGFTMKTSESEFRRVVRHEAGHTLGFPHEHQREAIVAKLDRESVIAEYMKHEGWSQEEVIEQVLTPIEVSSVWGTGVTEETSIMCYEFPGSLTIDGKPILGGADITRLDYEFAGKVYPKVGAAD